MVPGPTDAAAAGAKRYDAGGSDGGAAEGHGAPLTPAVAFVAMQRPFALVRP